jgi:DNA repair exonuclease SbcCD ATPase subunit
MKTLSVKQVSEALGVGTRAILKRLDKGQLRGLRRPNKFGVEEWWIYPTAEIKEALERTGRIDILGPTDRFVNADVLDVDAELSAPDDDETDEDAAGQPISSNHRGWTDEVRGSSHEMAEGVWNNIIGRFLGELKERDQLIGEMRSELADKERQLKLLPDFQKEMELRRQEAEANELKAAAFAKQIQAMKELEEAKAAEVERLVKLEAELVPSLQQQLEQERTEKAAELTLSQARLSALESEKLELADSKLRLEESLQSEIDRLIVEKEEQTRSIQSQFESLNQKLEKLEKPKVSWWKKMFGAGENAT